MAKDLLSATDVSMVFGGLKAVADFNMHIKYGELIGLIGPNGAGKTTAFNLLTGVYRPTTGEILFKDKSIVGLAPYEITARGIARTFQNIRLFGELSVLDNVKIAYHCHMNYGLVEAVQRRLEIARALAAQPALLLLDEPAAGMNPQETKELMEMIRWVKKEFGITILLIEHDMSLVMGICERIYVLEYGAIIANGSPEEIRKNPEVIRAYLGAEE